MGLRLIHHLSGTVVSLCPDRWFPILRTGGFTAPVYSIMAAENSKERFSDAVKLLNYGFGKCQIYTDDEMEAIPPVRVEGGVEEEADVEYAEQFTYLDMTGANLNQMEKKVEFKEEIKAPLKKGDVVGQAVYTLDGTEAGSVDLLAAEHAI